MLLLTIFLPLVMLTGVPDNALVIPGAAFRVVTQAPDNSGWVSPLPNDLTEFRAAGNVGAIGLLAHSGGAGQWFDDLHDGDALDLYRLGRSAQRYTVMEVRRFIALRPMDPATDFLDEYGHHYTNGEVFHAVYIPGFLTLQTCYTVNGDPFGGRLFVIGGRSEAMPARHQR